MPQNNNNNKTHMGVYSIQIRYNSEYLRSVYFKDR